MLCQVLGCKRNQGRGARLWPKKQFVMVTDVSLCAADGSQGSFVTTQRVSPQALGTPQLALSLLVTWRFRGLILH